jgi:hypothetical protein
MDGAVEHEVCVEVAADRERVARRRVTAGCAERPHGDGFEGTELGDERVREREAHVVVVGVARDEGPERKDGDRSRRSGHLVPRRSIRDQGDTRTVPERPPAGRFGSGGRLANRLPQILAQLRRALVPALDIGLEPPLNHLRVVQRTREFGVPMALGASAWRIVWGMLVETSRTAAMGLAAGLAVAAGLMRLFSSSNAILPAFGARPFVVGAAIVAVATAVAALAPLHAAARIDPAQALRTE